MQLSAALLLLIALVASVSAVSLAHREHAKGNETAAMQFLAPDAEAVASYFVSMRETLTQDDFLAAPFDTNNAEDAKVLEALTRNKEGFQAWRNNIARTAYHMEFNDYEALFDKHRTSLLDLAAQMSIPVENHKTSFDALLRKVDSELSFRERRSPKGAAASFVEARVAVSALHENAHLFRQRSTLHSLLVQDAVVYGVGEDIGKAFDWVVNNVSKHGCTLCKAVVTQIRRSFCQVAGKAICQALIGMIGGPLGVVAGKFFCAFPLYLSSLFSGWCIRGILWLQDKLKLSNDCLCSFSVPSFSIPATDFKVLGVSVFKNNRRDVNIGQICKTQPGQCAGSSTADSEKYAKMSAEKALARAKAQAEEAEMVSKMSKTEKIAYHTKILKGQIKTQLDDRLLSELLSAVTGLGQSVGGSLLKGATELAKGNVKGAAAAVATDLAKNTVKSVVQNVATTAAKGVTRATLGATITGTVNYGAKAVGNQVAKAATAASIKAGNNVKVIGTAAVNGAAAVTGVLASKAQADALRAKGQAAVNKAANVTQKVAHTVLDNAGALAVDVTRNAVSSHAGAKITGPTTGKVGDAVKGVFTTKPAATTGSF